MTDRLSLVYWHYLRPGILATLSVAFFAFAATTLIAVIFLSVLHLVPWLIWHR